MFALNNQDARLTSVNPRSELHGEDTVLACDLSFKITTSNALVDIDACLDVYYGIVDHTFENQIPY